MGRMDRRLASGTVNASQWGDGPPLVLLHSLLSDRASFDGILPELSKSFRVVVPELPGFGESQAVSGGLAAVADRMAGAIDDCADGGDGIVLGNGYGGLVPRAKGGPPPKNSKKNIFSPCGAGVFPP